MNTTTDGFPNGADIQPDEDPRLLRAAKEYLEAVEAGQRPSRKEFAARYADLSAELTPYLDAVDMLHPTPAPPSTPPGPDEPAALGDFRIVREIGRGGMGVVYEAVQLSLGRRVALKVLPFAAALDGKQLQRFKNEAQAAAQLHHTNIVPVYAVGVERGVHYYAMQLIEGQNLSDVIRQLRDERQDANRVERPTDVDAVSAPAAPQTTERPAPPPAQVPAASTRASLTVGKSTRRATRSPAFHKTAVGFVAQAAEALEHAHQLGVIHRDIKPANLMVDARANVWVTDFGLAQFQTCAGLTRTGDMLGTLRYMSPEQAGGQRAPVDARTDVYSLGATLYELLTLEPLFDGGDYQTLLRQILDDEPRPPRLLDRAVPPELETIVLKAVSKNPSDRYATAQEFADDLHRFQENLPIKARRPTLAQRIRKWGQRHPSVIFTSVAVLALVSVISLVSTVLVLNEQAKVLNEQAKTKAAYDSERERFKLAQKSVDEMFRLSEDELAGKPGTERLRKRILQSVSAYYGELIEQRRDDPKAQEELGNTRKQVANIVADLEVLEASGRLDLLSQPAVLEDLDLTELQRRKVKDLTDRLERERRERFGFGRGPLAPDNHRKDALDQARKNDAEVRMILNKEQLKRLPQIALQQQGTGAFREPDVAALLKLEPKQREEIRAIDERFFFTAMQEWRRALAPPDEPRRGGDVQKADTVRKTTDLAKTEEVRKAYETQRKEAMKAVLALLRPEQGRQWEEMIGTEFTGPVPMFLQVFPGGGPTGGGPKPPPGGGPPGGGLGSQPDRPK